MGERETGMRRVEISDWLEEVAGQLRTGNLMVDGENITVPEDPRARIKFRSKDGVRRLRLDLELPEDKSSKASKTSKKGKNGEKAKKSGKEQTLKIEDTFPKRDTGYSGQSRNGGSSKENGKRAEVRDHDSHVLVCKGGDCSKKGGKETKKALKSGLRAEGMNRDVRVDSVECLGLCKQGPNVIVYPEGSWYLGLKEKDVPLVIDEHLKNGDPVEHLTAERKPREKKKVNR